ncbi:MAG: TAXI family TRAP transporter solute-binding subunit [Thermovirgaceae bacterium]
MSLKKGILLFLVAALLTSAGTALAVERLSFATGGTAGTYYPIGSGIASIVTKQLPDLEITAETTGASVANLKMLRDKRVDLMLGASNTSWGAYEGHEPFEGEPVKNIRGIACLYPEIFQFVVREGSDQETIYDLKGKKVAVGAPGSGTERTAKMVLEAHGLTYDDIDVQFLNFGEAVTALKDRLIDCAVIGSGIPTSAVVDASASMEINLLELDIPVMEEFMEDRPYLTLITIPGETYTGVSEDVKAVASPAILSAEKDISEETVYKIVKAIFENLDELAGIHAQGKMIKLETALSAMSIPLHPGAKKYYKEVGVLK